VRPSAKQVTQMSSENGSERRLVSLWLGSNRQAAKIGELIVRSLRSCQKHVKNHHGKDALVLAKSILETNEIALVFRPSSAN